MCKAIALSFFCIYLEQTLLAVIIRRWDVFFAFESKFVAIAQWSWPFSEGSDIVIVVGGGGNVVGLGKSMSFWEGIELLWPGIIQRGSSSFKVSSHKYANNFIKIWIDIPICL